MSYCQPASQPASSITSLLSFPWVGLHWLVGLCLNGPWGPVRLLPLGRFVLSASWSLKVEGFIACKVDPDGLGLGLSHAKSKTVGPGIDRWPPLEVAELSLVVSE